MSDAKQIAQELQKLNATVERIEQAKYESNRYLAAISKEIIAFVDLYEKYEFHTDEEDGWYKKINHQQRAMIWQTLKRIETLLTEKNK